MKMTFNNNKEKNNYIIPSNFPKFEDNILSTRTFIITSNITIDIVNLHKYIPITPYVVIPKKRGRKRKIYSEDPNVNIENGSIITILNDDGTFKGVDLKKKKKEHRNVFRNSVTFVIKIDDKMINFKVSKNGKFQMTGCKNLNQSKKCIMFFWDYIRKYPFLYTLKNDSLLTLYFDPVLSNVGFNLGFMINREKLDKYIKQNTNYHSLWDLGFGYPGVNIKIPNLYTKDINIKKMTYKFIENNDIRPSTEGTWEEKFVSYEEYIKNVNKKENTEEKYITFLVFHSGKVNMSSDEYEFMDKPYYEFLEMINQCKDDIMENIDLCYKLDTKLKF